ncbi:hypothetical protein C8C83_3549 [Flavobacterium sp. 90]|nr:hypothetical protein C8C82_3867 [Flavobacterium sp. 81]TCK55575.1 hypothetical protein C8C83_3549 [Flavobacterium sp. 90]
MKFLDFIILKLTLSIGLVEFKIIFKTIKHYILKTTESISYNNILEKYTYNNCCYMCFCC